MHIHIENSSFSCAQSFYYLIYSTDKAMIPFVLLIFFLVSNYQSILYIQYDLKNLSVHNKIITNCMKIINKTAYSKLNTLSAMLGRRKVYIS